MGVFVAMQRQRVIGVFGALIANIFNVLEAIACVDWICSRRRRGD